MNIKGSGEKEQELCQTNQYGRSKFHYCKDGSAGRCRTDIPHPDTNPLCNTKMVQRRIQSGRYDEIMMSKFDKETKKLSHQFCFSNKNKENSTFGWCKTRGYYYDLHNPQKEYNSWGFCSKDCYLSAENKFGVLRFIDRVDVLSDEMCEEYLQWLLEGPVTVKPKILCVGLVTPWKIGHYLNG